MKTTELQNIKQRYNIVGNCEALNNALDVALKVSPIDLSVLIIGESCVGKDILPRIIHDNSPRRREKYFAINCGAIPEGTIDSELFGHVKGSFTGAINDSPGYFGVANKGTLFLDEVGELPLATQARLLRVLENGEYIRVGGSKVMKTNVRVVAATNVDLPLAIQKGKFREDLYYRLNTIPIHIPALRERKGDIYLLFRKFASDFAERSHMPVITLTPEAVKMLEEYRWDGNVRQLKNVAEQISIIEQQRIINEFTLERYLPNKITTALPVLFQKEDGADGVSERDLLYKVLFEMKHDIAELRNTVNELTNRSNNIGTNYIEPVTIEPDYAEVMPNEEVIHEVHEIKEEHEPASLSLEQNEIEMIKRALEKYNGKRKDAAKEYSMGDVEQEVYDEFLSKLDHEIDYEN